MNKLPIFVMGVMMHSPSLFAAEAADFSLMMFNWEKKTPDKIHLYHMVKMPDDLLLLPLHQRGFWCIKPDQIQPDKADAEVRFKFYQSDKPMDFEKEKGLSIDITNIPESGDIKINETIKVLTATGTQRSRPICFDWDGNQDMQEFSFNSTYYTYSASCEAPNVYYIDFSGSDVDDYLKSIHLHNSQYQEIPFTVVMGEDEEASKGVLPRRIVMAQCPVSMELECWKDVEMRDLPIKLRVQIPASTMNLIKGKSELKFHSRPASNQAAPGLEGAEIVEQLKYNLKAITMDVIKDQGTVRVIFDGPPAGDFCVEETDGHIFSGDPIPLKQDMTGATCRLDYGEVDTRKLESCCISYIGKSLPSYLKLDHVVKGYLHYNDVFSPIYPVKAGEDFSFYFEDTLVDCKHVDDKATGARFTVDLMGEEMYRYRLFTIIVRDDENKQQGMSYIDKRGKKMGKYYRSNGYSVQKNGFPMGGWDFKNLPTEIQIKHRSSTLEIENDLKFQIDLPILTKGAAVDQ